MKLILDSSLYQNMKRKIFIKQWTGVRETREVRERQEKWERERETKLVQVNYSSFLPIHFVFSQHLVSSSLEQFTSQFTRERTTTMSKTVLSNYLCPCTHLDRVCSNRVEKEKRWREKRTKEMKKRECWKEKERNKGTFRSLKQPLRVSDGLQKKGKKWIGENKSCEEEMFLKLVYFSHSLFLSSISLAVLRSFLSPFQLSFTPTPFL